MSAPFQRSAVVPQTAITVGGTGAQATFVPAPTFTGTVVLSYHVTDAAGAVSALVEHPVVVEAGAVVPTANRTGTTPTAAKAASSATAVRTGLARTGTDPAALVVLSLGLMALGGV